MTHEGTVVYIEDIAGTKGSRSSSGAGCTNRRSSGKNPLPDHPRRQRFIQGVMSKSGVDEATFRAADHLTQETSLIVSGKVRADARAPGGLRAGSQPSLEIIGASVDYPITPKEHGVDYLMDRRHLGSAASGSTRSCASGPR